MARHTAPSWWTCSLLLPPWLLGPAPDDHDGRLLIAPGAVAERGLAPGRLRMAAGARPALPAAMRVIEGIHGAAPDCRALAPPPALAGFAHVLVLVLDVAHL